MDKFFNPSSIAVVGASEEKGKVGSTLVNKLSKFKGKVFYVNPNHETIFGARCYKKMSDIKEEVELAIVAVPAKFVAGVLKECSCKNAIIISAGFGESGNIKLEEEITKIAKKKNIRVLGPNCFGVVNSAIGLDCTFSNLTPVPNGISFVSQSGALWSAIADYSNEKNIGFGKFASLGNMCDIDFCDILLYLNEDKETKVIIVYIETLKDGRRFMEIASRIKKPIVAIKGGKSKAGKRATASHTGSLAGSHEAYNAAFRQAGLICVNNFGEAVDTADFLVKFGRVGPRILVVTNAGGPGIVLSDFLEENGLELAELPKLKFNLPPAWSHGNPIDVVGDAGAERFREVFRKIEGKNFYDIIVCVLTPQSMTSSYEIACEIVKLKKPVVCAFMGFESFADSISLLKEKRIPIYFDLERAAKVLRNCRK